MSEWSGFDPRKICPQCGDYQTHFSKYERAPWPPQKRMFLVAAILINLVLCISSIALMLIKHVTPEPYRFIGLFFVVCVGLGDLLTYFFNYRRRKRELSFDSADPKHRLTVYSLKCWNCGYQWEKTIDEWEQEGKVNIG
jgi:hypothetical protein